MKPGEELIIADLGKAQNKLMCFTFGLVQILDGFKATNDNVKDKMQQFIEKKGFQNVLITKSMNTAASAVLITVSIVVVAINANF